MSWGIGRPDDLPRLTGATTDGTRVSITKGEYSPNGFLVLGKLVDRGTDYPYIPPRLRGQGEPMRRMKPC